MVIHCLIVATLAARYVRIINLLGYVPSKLAIGHDLSKGVASDWRNWSLKKNYLFADKTLTNTYYHQYQGHIHASGFISKELWSLADDGQWYLQEDDFSVLTQLEQPLEKAERTALVLVDLQNDYYSGGKFELQGIDAATEQARILLTHFRAHDLPVIHIQHIFKDSVAPFFNENTHGIEIETRVAPLDDEPVIVKHAIDSFTDTDLEQTLVELGIEKLVVVGAMAQACVQTICRTATHKGYECEVIADAIAAPQLTHPVQDFSGEQLVAANLISLSFGGAQAYSLHDWLAKYGK